MALKRNCAKDHCTPNLHEGEALGIALSIPIYGVEEERERTSELFWVVFITHQLRLAGNELRCSDLRFLVFGVFARRLSVVVPELDWANRNKGILYTKCRFI